MNKRMDADRRYGAGTVTVYDIRRLREVTESLAAVIVEECQALEERRFDRLKGLIERKLLLARSYEEMVSDYAGDNVDRLDSEAQEALRPATRSLRGALERHAVLAAAARTVAERLVRSFGEAVAREVRPVLGYGPGAVLRTATAISSAIAINANT